KILSNEDNKKTMLTEYFKLNTIDPKAQPINVREIWNQNIDAMAKDFIRKNIPRGQPYINAILKHIDSFLQQYDKNINNYDLPKTTNIINEDLPKIILEELSIPVLFDDIEKIKSLNESQKKAFDFIIQKINENKF
ncbi:8937_t:CDS:2, partial [Gigaspora margarita]